MLAALKCSCSSCRDATTTLAQRRAYSAMLWRVANDLQAEAEDIVDPKLGLQTLACADALIDLAKNLDAFNDLEAVHEGRDIEPLVVGG